MAVVLFRILLRCNRAMHSQQNCHDRKAINAHGQKNGHRRVGQGCADHFVCKSGGAAPPANPPASLDDIYLTAKNHVITMFAVRGGVVRIILCASGGAPPPPKAIHACNKAQASCHQHVCSKGRLFGSCCLQMRGLRPPNPAALLKPSMLRIENHVITLFAILGKVVRILVVANGGAAHCLRYIYIY